MNAVEIEEAISNLAEQAFDAANFPYAFLEAFGNKATTIKILKSGSSNASDIDGGVLQRKHIHIAVCAEGEVTATLNALKASPATAKAKAKFTLATDGITLEAEDLNTNETVACDYKDFPNHFGFFLPLAGITTVKQIRDNTFDIRATSRLNRLYVELLRNNPDWGTSERRHDMNHFMARLIFCFFAEDTDIFNGDNLFTATIEQMSAKDSSNTHEVISEIFRSMNTKTADRKKENIRSWADGFPYVNGGLFSGSTLSGEIEVPRFTKIARSYLLHVGTLDWKQINPDIFGSMIQAVADDEERGALGMHYTSVPNILKVLNPLFLDDLREQLEQAEDNPRKLLNLRKRMSNIRVFDPACGSGNFLVIAYKQMREIEAKINELRGEKDRPTDIPLTNFRGIELRDFPAEIARLALIIAEYQSDVIYRGQKLALAEFLPLDTENWIASGNALDIDWLSFCPSWGKEVKLIGDDLFNTPQNSVEVDFENEGGETYICGNPPYIGTKYQSKEVKKEIEKVFGGEKINFGNIDYVGCWFLMAAKYIRHSGGGLFSFVTTSSLFQGEQAEVILYILNKYGITISSAKTSFMWSNNAAKNAGVTCSIIACALDENRIEKYIFDKDAKRKVENIGPYLVAMPSVVATKRSSPISNISEMKYGSMANDNGNFTVSDEQYRKLISKNIEYNEIIKRAMGGAEFIRGIVRRSFYIDESSIISENVMTELRGMFEAVKSYRAESKRPATQKLSLTPMLYAERRHKESVKLFIPQVMSERREYITVGLLNKSDLVIAPHMQIIGGALYELSLLSSSLHHVWIETVCGKLKSDIRYSNLLGWNTFPVPSLTEKNKEDLTRCAEDILLAREAHFPATIADLYDPEKMPEILRHAHERNDEVLERIYIGRRFKNDTERLEKLFDLYTKMTTNSKKKVS